MKLKRFIAIPLFLAVWEFVVRLRLVNPMLLPPFSEIILSMDGLLAKGDLPKHILLSLQRALGGFVLALLVGIPAGLLIGGLSRRVQLALEPVVEVLSQLNPFVLYHLILIFMGIGEATKITIIFWACVWPILFSTISGVCNIDPVYLKCAAALSLNRRKLAVKVMLPAAIPQIMVGVRLSAGYSLFMLIAAEMMGAESGLGFLVVLSQRYYQIRWVYATVIIIALLGVLGDGAIYWVEKRFLSRYFQEEANA